MAEVLFVVKSFVITAVLFVALQLDISGVRAEKHLSEYLRHGRIVGWVRDAVKGGEQLVAEQLKKSNLNLKIENPLPSIQDKIEKVREVSSQIKDSEFPEEVDIKDHLPKVDGF